jgi:hypothetical protein
MRRLWVVVLATTILLAVLPVQGGWVRGNLVDPKTGHIPCVYQETGTKADSGYASKTTAATVCNAWNKLFAFMGTADAVTLPFTLNCAGNPDGACDTQYPCVKADRSDCKDPAILTLNCDNTAAPPLIGLQTGTAYSANYRQFFSGTGAATAVLSVVSVSGTDATTQWSISSSGTGNNLINAGSATGAGALKIRGTVSGNSKDCGTQNWSYVSPPTSDTTPPNPVTGITATPGTNTVTVAFDLTNDPNDGVQRKGVATYNIKLNGSMVDTLVAPTPGLTNDFTATAIGTGVTGSATQAAAPTGGKWTVATTGTAGYGLEGGKDDAFEAALAPVAGTTPCVFSLPAAIPNVATYNKAIGATIGNSSSLTSARLSTVVLRTGANYLLQYNLRPTDGGTLSTSSSVALTGVPYTAECISANVATIYYSYDGGSWTVGFSNIAITLNDSKVAGCGAAATNDGTTGVAISIDFTYCQVTNSGRASKTVSTMTGGTWTVTALDAETIPNESAATGGVSATPNVGGASLKWNPGHYVRAHTHNLSCGTNCDAARHNLYSAFSLGTDSHVIGTEIWIDWKYLESDAGNNFASGISWLTNELAFVNTNYPGKKVGVLINLGLYGPSSLTQCSTYYPQYLCDANCLYMEMSAGASGGSDSMDLLKTDSTCLGYFTRLLAAYGAQFDSNATLAFVRIQQETDDAVGNVGISGAAEDAAWKNVALAARQAFPTTLIWIPLNWTGVNTPASVEALFAYYKSIAVGVGDGDTIPAPPSTFPFGYSCPNTATGCVIRGLNSSAGASSHDYCGEFVSMKSVELSEMGYGSVGGHPGLSSQQVVDVSNSQACAHYLIWEPNFNEIFDRGDGGASQYWSGATGQKHIIDTVPLTHLTKPSGYP